MSSPTSDPTPPQLYSYIDSHSTAFIARLREAVEIPSVSGEAARRPEVVHMAHWVKAQLERVGATVRLVELGEQELDGQKVKLPPAVLAQLGEDPKKKTITIYGHFDVQPAERSDGWDTEPFELVHDEKTGRLIGRGSTDDKGPIVGWINAIEAHVEQGIELPVNLKFVLEGMEESGSEGLDELVIREAQGFLKDTDAVCISDNYWLTTSKPALTHGLRGLSYFKATVSGPARDLHSGVFGGTIHEPMTDLIHLMGKLVLPSGEILVPGLKELVAPLTEAERKRFDAIEFDVKDLYDAAGSKTTISDDKVTALMGRMRYPSLSLHGIEGAFYGAGAKTVIPAAVHGKFSIRLVPDMDPDVVGDLVKKYLECEFANLNSKNTLKVEMLSGGKAWVADPEHPNYEAAARAIKTVYGVEPDLTREGGSIPVTLTFAEALGVNVLLLPMGRSDDGAHSTNEKLDVSNYIQGTKTFAAYLHEVAKAL